MIPEIGVMLGLFILASLAAARDGSGNPRSILAGALSALAALVAVIVTASLAYRGSSDWLSARAAKQQAPEAPRPTAVGQTVKPRIEVHKIAACGFEMTFPYLGVRKLAETAMQRECIVLNDAGLP